MKEKKFYTVEEIRDKLAAYCAYQDRCHWEVEQKLKAYDLSADAMDHITLYLMRHNFLNEERFAKSFARGKFYQKSWGKIKIKVELKRKKITPRLINTALQEIEEKDYRATINQLIEKKAASISEVNAYKKNQKIIRYMLQKGYEYALVKEALDL